MPLSGEGGEELTDKLPIGVELGSAIGENKDSGVQVGFPGNGPIGMGSDSLRRSAGSDSDLESSQFLLPPLVWGHCVYSG